VITKSETHLSQRCRWVGKKKGTTKANQNLEGITRNVTPEGREIKWDSEGELVLCYRICKEDGEGERE